MMADSLSHSCPTCGGKGEVCSMFCDSNDATVDAHPHHVPCPECARVFKQLYAVVLDMQRRGGWK